MAMVFPQLDVAIFISFMAKGNLKLVNIFRVDLYLI